MTDSILPYSGWFSRHLRTLKMRELRKLEKEYDEICYGPNACYGVKDMIWLDEIQKEIFRREETSD